MTAFIDEYPDVAVSQLSINYRSSQEIVDTVVGFAPHMGASQGMLPLALTADRGSTTSAAVEAFRHAGPGDGRPRREHSRVGDRRRPAARPSRALPFRMGGCYEIAAALEARGIPVLHLGSLFERGKYETCWHSSASPSTIRRRVCVRVGAMPRYALSLQDVRTMTLHLRETDQAALENRPRSSQRRNYPRWSTRPCASCRRS